MEDQLKLNISDMLNQLSERLKDDHNATNDIEMLGDLMNSGGLYSLMQIQETLQENSSSIPHSADNAVSLVSDLQQLSRLYPSNDILSALSAMFKSSQHLVSLLSCHDKIASRTFDEPQLSPIVDDTIYQNDDNEETMKVVRLVKGDEPLGATIASDDLTGDIVIARILKGGAADRSGLIHVNDILVEVNDVSTKGKKPTELIKLLAGYKGPLIFKVIPGETPIEADDEESIFVRSHFTYLPQADPLIPCVEAGLTFYPGDVLKIVSKDDLLWWQAIKIESRDKIKSNGTKVGLVPSLKLQTRREKLKRQAESRPTSASIKGSNISLLSSGKGNTWNRIRSSFRRKRNAHAPVANKSDKNQMPYYLPYESVARYDPTKSRLYGTGLKTYRPMILVGPQGIGRNELKDRLIDSNPSHYGVPVPHTSRPQHPGEVDKKDYHFVTRECMEVGIRQGRFLEYGEYKGNYYGTSLDAVHAVVESGLVCVLTPYPQALPVLRSKEFFSYVIFMKPPSVVEMERLNDVGAGHNDVKGRLTIERQENAPFSLDEMYNFASRADKMQSMYGRLFDTTIVVKDKEQAFNKLKEISFILENDEQWVPADWIS